MTPRIDSNKAAPGAVQALLGVHHYIEKCGLEEELLHLIFLRASQINGCAYCTDMHWKDARAVGTSEQKLSLLTAWREVRLFTDRERAALDWTEAVTLVANGPVSDEVYAHAREYFGETELVNLTLAIGSINAWNRLAIAFRPEVGRYKSSRATV